MPKRLKQRKKSLVHVSDSGVEITQVYCRRCMKNKPPKDFYKAVDHFLDSSGVMSICSACISDIYIRQYNVERDLRRAIYKTCQIVNILYTDSAVQATETHLKNKEILPDHPSVFGMYKSKIASTLKGVGVAKMDDSVAMDFTFRYENSSIPEHSPEELDFGGAEGVIEFWGDGYGIEEYRFLEKELADWKRSYSCQNKAEEFFLKQICMKSLELEKAKKEGKSGDGILKSMQDLLKNAALTPAQQTAASSGKGTETWGVFIKNIEETTPAEYYKDKELFKDFDGIEEYIKRYITRPLKNFVTGSRDFNVTEEDTTEYDEPSLEVIDEPEAGKTE